MSLPAAPPDRTRVLVIGGGPAGSTSAMLLAREGIDVTVLERDRFPRYHIGESLLPSIHPVLELGGLREKMDAFGFVRKYGGFFRVKQGTPAGHVDFGRNKIHKYSYQVRRSDFDKLLLDHAREQGATVYEETTVNEVIFNGQRPVAVDWSRPDGNTGRTSFDYLVDASGLTGLVAKRYLKNRQVQEAFANVAIGGYWTGAAPYQDMGGTMHPGAFSMEALADSSGWTWAIPLHDGTLSVGVVVHRDTYRKWKEQFGSPDGIYKHGLSLCPDILLLLENATFQGELREWQDYSYVADTFSGQNLRLVGDAAAFIDPLFSSGVHLALLGGLSAATTIRAVDRGEIDEAGAGHFHDRYIRRAYTRFVVMVAGFYNQIRQQQAVTLKGVDAQSFQDAFNLIQPVVSGNTDVNQRDLNPETLHRTMKYTTDMAMEMHNLATGNPVAKLMSVKAMEDEIGDPFDAIDGHYIRMERGELGLVEMSRMAGWFQGLKESAIKVAIRGADQLGRN
jgi:flavin-dependent dehydrogenase